MLTIDQIKVVVADYFKNKPVKQVYLFGSYARGEAEENSDIDLTVKLKENSRISYFTLAGYSLDLQDMFLKNVDLVLDSCLYPRIKRYVDSEKIEVYSSL